MNRAFHLGLALGVFVAGGAVALACGDDEAAPGSSSGTNPNNEAGASSSGGDGGDGEPPKPPRTDPVVPTDHPRIFFSTGNKERLNAKLAASTPEATRFRNMVDKQIAGTNHYAFEYWNAALLGALTGDPKYCGYAISKTDEHVTAEEGRIAANQRAEVANDSYLEVGKIIGSMAMVYDWCFATLTPEQRTRWANYGHQAVWNVWHHEQAKWGNTVHEWSGWSVDNPFNNYHYSFLRATMLLGLATHKEHAEGPALVDLFRKDKLNKVVTAFNEKLEGGGSREGTGYGTATRDLYEIYDFWEGSTTERVWDLTPTTRQSLAHFMHTTAPTLDRLAPIGDHARDSTAAIFDYHREQVLVLQKLLGPGDQLGEVAQSFLEGLSVKEMEQFFQFVWDFLYSDTAHAKQPLDKLNTTYYGSGTGMTFMRSSWAADATYGALIAGPLTESHAHRDQGSLLFFKNQWLAFDPNMISKSGLRQEEEAHNLVRLIENGTTLKMRYEKNPGETTALSQDANVVHWAGKMQALYDKPSVTRVEREVVFIKSLDTFVVFDRIDADNATSAWQLSSYNAPVNNAGKWTVTKDAATLDIFPLLPAGATANVVSWPSVDSDYNPASRLDISSTGHTRYLSVLAAGGRVQSATTSSAAGNSVATITFAGGATATVTFSTDGSGGQVTINGGGLTVDKALTAGIQAPALFNP